MKLLIILCILSITSFSQKLYVPKELSENFQSFNDIQLILTKGTKESFESLKESEPKLSVVRGDLLYLAQNGIDNFKYKDYLVISKVKEQSYLYMVAKSGIHITHIEDLKGMKISIEFFDNMSNRYLKDIIHELNEDILLTIHFQSCSLDESLERIKAGKTDLLFAFGLKEFENKIQKNGLQSLVIPKKFINILQKNKAFIIDNNIVKVDNYIVSSIDIDEKFLTPLIKDLQDKTTILTTVSEYIGKLNPSIPKVLSNIEIAVQNKKENSEKREKMKKILSDIENEKKSIQKVIKNIKKDIPHIRKQSSKFIKVSLQLTYKKKVDHILDKIEIEKKKIKLKSMNFQIAKEEEDIAGLKAYLNDLQTINIVLSNYAIEVKDVDAEILIKLSEEKEAIEKAAKDVKANKSWLGF